MSDTLILYCPTANNDIAVANGYIFIFKIQKYNFFIQQRWIYFKYIWQIAINAGSLF